MEKLHGHGSAELLAKQFDGHTIECVHTLGLPVGSHVRDPSVGQWQDNIREFFYMEELLVKQFSKLVLGLKKLSPDDETFFPTRAGGPQSKHPMVADI